MEETGEFFETGSDFVTETGSNESVCELQSSDCTIREMQRRRRRMRVELLRNKRLRSAHKSKLSNRPQIRVVDPKVLRKLKNRASAEKSRQKIIDTIDRLTKTLYGRKVELCRLELCRVSLQQQQCSLSSSPSFPSIQQDFGPGVEFYDFDSIDSHSFDESCKSLSDSSESDETAFEQEAWMDALLDSEWLSSDLLN